MAVKYNPNPKHIRQCFWITFKYGFSFAGSQQTVFTNNAHNDFWECSSGHAEISMTDSCLLSMQCLLKSRRSQTSSTDFLPRLLHTEIFPDSLNLMCCIMRSSKCSQFYIKLNYSEIVPRYVDAVLAAWQTSAHELFCFP